MTKREQDMLRELCDLEDGLSSWEVEFVENLSHYEPERVLTEKQKACLRKIHAQKTGEQNDDPEDNWKAWNDD